MGTQDAGARADAVLLNSDLICDDDQWTESFFTTGDGQSRRRYVF